MAGPFTIKASDLLANDTGDNLAIVAVGQPSAGGTATLNFAAQTILYAVPPKGSDGNYPATDTFTYTARDSHGNTAVATVTLTLRGCTDNGDGTPPPPSGATCGPEIILSRQFDASTIKRGRIGTSELTWLNGMIAIAVVVFTRLDNDPANMSKSWAPEDWAQIAYITQSNDRASVVFKKYVTQADADLYNTKGVQLCVPGGDDGIGGRIYVIDAHYANAPVTVTGGDLDNFTGHSGMMRPLDGPLISINTLFTQPNDNTKLSTSSSPEFVIEPQLIPVMYAGQEITGSAQSITILKGTDRQAPDGPDFSLSNVYNGYFMQVQLPYYECADTTPNTGAFVGPNLAGALRAISTPGAAIGMIFNPGISDRITFGNDVFAVGTLIVWPNRPMPTIDPAWNVDTTFFYSNDSGAKLLTFTRTFTAADFKSKMDSGYIPVILGDTLDTSEGHAYTTAIQCFTTPGYTTASLFKNFDVFIFGSEQGQVNSIAFSYGTSKWFFVEAHGMLTTALTDVSANPMTSTPPNQFFGNYNDFVAQEYGTVDPTGKVTGETMADMTFQGQDGAFVVYQIFDAIYK